MRAETRGQTGADHKIDDIKLFAIEHRLVVVECARLLTGRP